MKEHKKVTIHFLKPVETHEKTKYGVSHEIEDVYGFDDPEVKYVRVEGKTKRHYIPKSNIGLWIEHD